MKPTCPWNAKASHYVHGLLSGPDAMSFEQHAVTCQACSEALNVLLAPEREFVRAAYPLQPVPTHLEAVATPPNHLKWQSFAIAATVLSALVLKSGKPHAEILLLSGDNKVEQLPGGRERFRTNVLIRTTQPSKLEVDGLTIASPTSLNEFSLQLSGGTWIVRSPLSNLLLVHPSGEQHYLIVAGDRQFEPLGTRFQVTPEGALEVYESSVMVSGKVKQQVNAGFKLNASGMSPITDDPALFLNGVPKLPPIIAQWLPESPAQFDSAITPEASSTIRRELTSGDTNCHARIALLLTRNYDQGGSEIALRLAAREDPRIRSTSPENLELMFLNQSAFGSDRAASLIAQVNETREEREQSHWIRQLATASLREKVKVALSVATTASGETAIAAAAVASHAAISSGIDRNELQQDSDALRRVTTILQEIWIRDRESLSTRARATLLAELAEAQRYLPETELESLDSLRQSVNIWRKPSRVVHYCARLAELSRPTNQDRSLLLSAFVADPTFANAERVLTFLRDTANSPSRVTAVATFARWISETFRSVPNAQAIAAEHLMEIVPSQAAASFERMVKIVNGDLMKLEAHHVDAYARYLLRTSTQPNHSEVIEKISKQCQLQVNGQYSPTSLPFLEEAGLYEIALKVVEDSTMPRDRRLFTIATLLRKLKRPNESIEAYRAFAKARGKHRMDIQDLDAKLCIAEQMITLDRALVRSIAQSVLASDMSGLRQGWREIRRFDLNFMARSEWLLGDRSRAIDLQRKFLSKWSSNAIKKIEEARLSTWIRASRAQR